VPKQGAPHDDISNFVSKVQHAYKTGIAREHAYRPALHDLLKALGEEVAREI